MATTGGGNWGDGVGDGSNTGDGGGTGDGGLGGSNGSSQTYSIAVSVKLEVTTPDGVVDAGIGSAFIFVHLTDEYGNTAGSAVWEPGSDGGEFQFKDLPAGTYTATGYQYIGDLTYEYDQWVYTEPEGSGEGDGSGSGSGSGEGDGWAPPDGEGEGSGSESGSDEPTSDDPTHNGWTLERRTLTLPVTVSGGPYTVTVGGGNGGTGGDPNVMAAGMVPGGVGALFFAANINVAATLKRYNELLDAVLEAELQLEADEPAIRLELSTRKRLMEELRNAPSSLTAAELQEQKDKISDCNHRLNELRRDFRDLYFPYKYNHGVARGLYGLLSLALAFAPGSFQLDTISEAFVPKPRSLGDPQIA